MKIIILSNFIQIVFINGRLGEKSINGQHQEAQGGGINIRIKSAASASYVHRHGK